MRDVLRDNWFPGVTGGDTYHYNTELFQTIIERYQARGVTHLCHVLLT